MIRESIHDRACGRWPSILRAIGIDSRYLSKKPGPCPICGDGTDRWVFDDKDGRGTWICRKCPSHKSDLVASGNGVDLVMRFKNVDFKTAATLIEEHIGSAPVRAPIKATKSETQREEDKRDQMAALWGRARPLTGDDLASRYLASRGIFRDKWPAALRVIDELPYWENEKTRALYTAMLAKFAAHDGKSAILHRTYLIEPGRKADIEKPRMLMPGKVPHGGAVRLSQPAETMGIAEGIETALSAAALFRVPVWAALTAGALIKWQPPKEAKCILIFGDSDESFAGQNAAYALAYRLKTEKYEVDMRLPDTLGCDWNDQLRAESIAA